jgi:hypothetical protein
VTGLDPAIQLVLRLAGALLFLAAAAHKLREPADFRAALLGYRLLPPRAVPLAAGALAALEGAAGVALLLPAGAPAGALAGAGLLAVYGGAIAVNLRRGRRDIDCGCGGPGGRRPLGWALVARNAVLIAGLGASTLPLAERAISTLDLLSIPAAVAALALLYAAADVALANQARLGAGRDRAWSAP